MRPIKRPGKTSFTRVWIDRERSMPLRLEIYDRHPSSPKARMLSEVKSIELYQLPNGGWFQVRGTRILHHRSPKPHLSFNHTTVDVNSITIKREDIPDSLFTIEFPEGAEVYNAITGVTTKGGKVADPRLEDVIDESIKNLNDSNIEPKDSPPSEQAPNEPPPNEPVSSTEESRDTLADVMPTVGKRSYMAWILMPAFLSSFAAIGIIFILRNLSRKNSKGGMSNEN